MTKKTIEGKRTKLAILGCAMETLPLAPFDDPSWEIWSSGQWVETVKRWDSWYELHAIDSLPKSFKFHLDWMVKQTKPIYISRPSKWAPSGKIFPQEQIEENHGAEFLTSTIASMFAKAIDDGYKEVGLWGVEMASDAEYYYQRSGVKHFQYIAERYHGIKVTIPPESMLAVEKEPYPFCQESPFTRFVVGRDKMVKDQLATVTGQHNLLGIQAAECRGALQVLHIVKRQIAWPD